ncbi:Nucleoside H+ symporter [compost metagenome]
MVASFLFPTLIGRLSTNGAVDYTSLFLVPTGMALAAVLLLALFFRPPSRGPVAEADETDPVATASPAQP